MPDPSVVLTVADWDAVSLRNKYTALDHRMLRISVLKCDKEATPTTGVQCAEDEAIKEFFTKYEFAMGTIINFVNYEKVSQDGTHIEGRFDVVHFSKIDLDARPSYSIKWIEHKVSLQDSLINILM